MNKIQKIIYWCAKEAEGIWDIIDEISGSENISKLKAIELFMKEFDFIKQNNEILLLKSDKLYDNLSIKVLDKNALLSFKYKDFQFNKTGPFYYLSDMPCV